YESVFRLLRCGLTDITEEETDRLENYVVAMGIRGFAAWNREWVRTYRGQNPEECVLLNEIRTRLVDMWEPFYTKMREKGADITDYARALYEYICSNHIQEKMQAYAEKFRQEENLSMVKEYSQIYEIVMNLLDKLVEILGEKSLRGLGDSDAGLSSQGGIVLPTSDQVLVGDMERTRLKDIKILFFAGVNEGKIPKETQAGKLLSDLNREDGNLWNGGVVPMPTAKESLYTQKFYCI
ncbi:MAG: helicase-exonuclease AddAB subunit AddB, partial [Blautia faecis]